MKILGILLVGFALSILFYFFIIRYFYPHKGSAPLKSQSIKIELKQIEHNILQLNSLKIVPIKPSNYKLNITNNYYQIFITNSQNKLIFSGKILNKFIIPPPDFSGDSNVVTVKYPENYFLYLPVYQNHKKLLITDEQGKMILEIPLDQIKVIQ